RQNEIRTITAGDGVVAGARVDGQARERRQTVAGDDRIVASTCIDEDVLDATDVHYDCVDITRDRNMRAIRRDRDRLVGARTVEAQRIRAGAAIDNVTAVTRIPGEEIVTAAEKHNIVAGARDDNVVAVA